MTEEAGVTRAAPSNRREPSIARTEKQEQAMCVKFYRSVGCTTYSTSQARRSHVALGLPDLLVCWPVRGTLWAHEVKRIGGKLSEDQKRFRDTWTRSGGLHVVGGLAEAVKMVEQVRNLTADPWPSAPQLPEHDPNKK